MEAAACAITGHRPSKLPWKGNETDPRCVLLKEVLTAQIVKLAEAGVTYYLSGMALGTDIYCAEIVLALRVKNPAIKLYCVLPCKDQADKWTAPERARYQSVLDRADSVIYVSQTYHANCMMERNHYLVDHASILLAVYNGTRRSGTGATINYARKLGRKIIILNPTSNLVTCENDQAKHPRAVTSSEG